MFCSKCGKEISNDSKFCYSCGSKTIHSWNNNISSASDNILTTNIPEVKTNNIGSEKDESRMSSLENDLELSNTSNNILSEDENKIIDDKILISNTVEDCFKTFKRIVISMYLVLFLMVIVSNIYKPFSPFAFWGYIILIFYFWTHLWSCSRLVGRSPILWILLTVVLSFIGPVVAYSMLKKSAVDQNIILKPGKIEGYNI